MTSARWRIGEGTGPRGFVATLWLAIATALLCAMVPAGPPQSQLVGSAFSPATTGVALRAEAPTHQLALRRTAVGNDDGPSPPPALAAALFARAAIAAPAGLQPSPAWVLRDAPLLVQRPEVAPARPRAPPSA